MIKSQILPSHFSMHLQGHFFLLKLSLEYAFGGSNTKLKLLILLVIILLFGFVINVIDERGSARIRI